MKCEICKLEIQKLFLDKISGTFLKKDSKKVAICSKCQSNNSSKDLLELI